MNNENTLVDVIIRLRRYNEWRRGGDFEQPCPVEIGVDIDNAIEFLEQIDVKETAKETMSFMDYLTGPKDPKN